MAHRIADTVANKVVVNKFGTGKHGYTDVAPDATRLPEDIVSMVQEEFARTVEVEFTLSGHEASVGDPKYNQLMHLVHGIPSVNAAMNMVEFQTGVGNYFTGCPTLVFATDATALKTDAFAMWGEGFQVSKFGNDG